MLTLPERRDEPPVRAFRVWLMEEAEHDGQARGDGGGDGSAIYDTRVS